MNKTQILTSILFALMTLVVFVQSSSHHGGGIPQIQLSILTLMSAIGVFISGGAAFAMFFKCIGGASLEQQSPWLFPLFSGLLLIQVHWTLAIPLGLLCIGYLVLRVCELLANGRQPTSSSDS